MPVSLQVTESCAGNSCHVVVGRAALRAAKPRGKAYVFSRIARYAIATGRAERGVAHDLRSYAAAAVRDFASITDPTKIGPLLRALIGYVGQPATRAALRLAPLTFVRPGELGVAAGKQFDLDAKEIGRKAYVVRTPVLDGESRGDNNSRIPLQH